MEDVTRWRKDMDFIFGVIFSIYYIDASVLLGNNQWHIFNILTSEDIDDVIYRFLHRIYIIKRKLHGGLKIWTLSSRDENNILLIIII